MGKGNYASSIRKLGKSYETDLTKPNIEGVVTFQNRPGGRDVVAEIAAVHQKIDFSLGGAPEDGFETF